MSSRYLRNEAVEESQVAERVVLYHQESGKALVLNPTGSWLWSQLQAPHSADELAGRLCDKHESLSADQATQDVQAYLQELTAHDAVRVVE